MSEKSKADRVLEKLIKLTESDQLHWTISFEDHTNQYPCFSGKYGDKWQHRIAKRDEVETTYIPSRWIKRFEKKVTTLKTTYILLATSAKSRFINYAPVYELSSCQSLLKKLYDTIASKDLQKIEQYFDLMLEEPNVETIDLLEKTPRKRIDDD